MNKVKITKSDLDASEISLGCMRIAGLANQEISSLIHTALDEGINFFDHADIYGAGKSEAKFAEAINMTSSLRAKMILQSKCGVRPNSYDFSKEYILEAVAGSLKRLRTDYLDVLLLHRPDALI
jgi:predicted oxidoreductase